MKRVLIYKNISECPLDFDVITPVDYENIAEIHRQTGGNSGNKVHYTSVYQYLTNPNIEYKNLTSDMTPDFINNNFDMVIFPTANILNAAPPVVDEITKCAEVFNKLKIPVFPIGCGCQARSYKDLNTLIKQIKKPAYNFIKSVYNTGGEFALRGFFTKECFEKLGFHSAVVTGCPSMYQNGRDLKISNDKVSPDKFRPIINGTINYLNKEKIQKIFEEYKNAIYICQEQFLEILYSHKTRLDVSENAILSELKKYGYTGLKLLYEGRVKLFYDFPVWKNFIKENGYNFSFGTRIHGNIAAILSGCPAMPEYPDTRVQELAEFFDIPCISKFPENKNLYDLYCEADYTKFNQTFAQKFDNFEKFLSDCGITNSIQDKTLFSQKTETQKYTMPIVTNKEYIETIFEFLDSKKAQKNIIFKKYLNKILWKLCFGKNRKLYKAKYDYYKTILKRITDKNPR